MNLGWHCTLAESPWVPYVPHGPQPLTSRLLRCPGRGIHASSHVGAARPHVSARLLRGTGTNHAALGSREAILSPTSFSLLTGNLHQLFRLLSEGAEQTQPQQDTQVGAAWRDLGGHGSPLHPRPVSLGPVCALVCGCAWAGLQAGMLVAGCAHSVCCFSAFWQGAHIVCSAFGALSSLPVL